MRSQPHSATGLPAQTGKFSSVVKVIAVNVVLVVAGLAAAELAFGSWFSDAHALYQFTKPRNLAIVQDNPFGDDPKEIRYTRDANGFRGLDGPVDRIDIITIGGSTTDQRFIDDGQTYQAVLKDLFGREGRHLAIANAGIDGQSTVGHIHNFSSWFDKIDGLKTKYILYYIGINDILRMEQTKSYDVVESESRLLDWQLYIREKSVFYQLYLILKQQLAPNPYRHGATRDHVVDVAKAVERGNLAGYDTPDTRESLAELGRRVAELDRLTRQMGATSIFVTQRSARWQRVDGKIVGIPSYLKGDESEFARLGDVNGVDIHQVERLVAGTIMAECQTVGAVCLNLMEEIEFALPDDYYDPVHTSASGASAIGEYLYRTLRQRL